MGSSVSPTLANLTLYPLEQEFLKSTKHIINYWRYLDDCIIIFKGEKDELEKNIEYLNSMHPTIKFTATISNSQINYLDITVFKGTRLEIVASWTSKCIQKNVKHSCTSCLPQPTHHQLFPVSSKESFYESSETQVMKKMRQNEQTCLPKNS